MLVDKSPKAMFDAVNNVRGWSEKIDGSTDKLGAEFKFHYKDLHLASQATKQKAGEAFSPALFVHVLCKGRTTAPEMFPEGNPM